jgi:hypothetical protein
MRFNRVTRVDAVNVNLISQLRNKHSEVPLTAAFPRFNSL